MIGDGFESGLSKWVKSAERVMPRRSLFEAKQGIDLGLLWCFHVQRGWSLTWYPHKEPY